MILFLLLFGFAGAIPPLQDFEEGSCLQTNSITHTALSREFISNLKYIMGGSKYFMYLFPSSLPSYKNLTEQEFINTACIQQSTNATDPSQPSAIYYFGEKITSTGFTTETENIKGTLLGPAAKGETHETVAFTDGKTFAFLITCWGQKQRAWELVATSPIISPSTMKAIEERAVQLGFKRENFVFLNYDKCKHF